MMKQRLVLETTEDRKAALAERLDLQGESFSEWVEGHIDSAIAPSIEKNAEQIRQPSSMTTLLETDILEDLSNIDWAFSSANTRYLTHDLHPYPAKFPPQIPARIIESLTMPGDVVFDPFGGSGTTAVEAVRLRRRAISMDANPLSSIVGQTKIAYLDENTAKSVDQLSTVVGGYISDSEGRPNEWSKKLLSSHSDYIPEIPNFDKWFCTPAAGELALLRHLIDSTTSGLAEQIALIAFSRIVTRVSNQDSETRYVASKTGVPIGFTLRAFRDSLRSVIDKLNVARSTLRGASVSFLQADTRKAIPQLVAPSSVDLIVTSPPYPNATDYHLYHRFRLFWLGFDPRSFGSVEIGSHLKHQRKGTDFSEYEEEMALVLNDCFHVLQPGRFAVFIVGDAVFKGEKFSTSDALADVASGCGFEVVGAITRPIHDTKRSFAKAARRARNEQLLILRKPNSSVSISISQPEYKMHDFEKDLRLSELSGLGLGEAQLNRKLTVNVNQPTLWNLRRATFSTSVLVDGSTSAQPMWQKVLENGDAKRATRKDPKYATHGLHPYKGKFYPQLAKSLLNSSGVDCGSRILDPYCGSGTVPLECLLNGHKAYGFDMNPLAVKIARAKTGILLIDPQLVETSVQSLNQGLFDGKFSSSMDQFPGDTHKELLSWFPEPVLVKLNTLLARIRLLGHSTIIDYFEVILSSLIREVSHQDPTDLRIRRRKEPISDAPIFELFSTQLDKQIERLSKYWSVAARQPGRRLTPTIFEADSRLIDSFEEAEIDKESIDCVVTSPPYATALPYIDTDRLSILAILGVASSERSVVERNLTGSREIRTKEKVEYEQILGLRKTELPISIEETLLAIMHGNKGDKAGFRRKNMPALLTRYFQGISQTLEQVQRTMKSGALAYYVVGDSRTKVGEEWFTIPTCTHVGEIAVSLGFEQLSPISIDVTTERMLHMKNAITKNNILIFKKV